jgi:hypothetical protein
VTRRVPAARSSVSSLAVMKKRLLLAPLGAQSDGTAGVSMSNL